MEIENEINQMQQHLQEFKDLYRERKLEEKQIPEILLNIISNLTETCHKLIIEKEELLEEINRLNE